MGNNPVGGLRVAKHVPRQTPSPTDRALLLHNTFAKEGPAPEGLRHSSSARRENTHTFLRKERACSILLLRGSGHHLHEAAWPEPALEGQCEAACWPCCLSSIITVNQQHAGTHVPAAAACCLPGEGLERP